MHWRASFAAKRGRAGARARRRLKSIIIIVLVVFVRTASKRRPARRPARRLFATHTTNDWLEKLCAYNGLIGARTMAKTSQNGASPKWLHCASQHKRVCYSIASWRRQTARRRPKRSLLSLSLSLVGLNKPNGVCFVGWLAGWTSDWPAVCCQLTPTIADFNQIACAHTHN